ncbi:MAG: M1 family metallopeptidase [Bacteroidota bacterium]
MNPFNQATPFMVQIRRFLFIIFLFPAFALPQSERWQQRVEYQMDIDFDVVNHQFSGTQKLLYFNESPDTLKRAYFHLYFNAFQPGSMMDVRSRTIADPSPKIGSRILALSDKEIGYHKITRLKQNGKDVIYDVVGTILEITLTEPILPRTQSVFEMTFDSQVPVQIRRSGRDNKEGIAYSMSQWYPKIAEYDQDGWNANPYIGREFHGVWGSFDVKLSIDSSYVVAGTGNLLNPQQIGHGYQAKGQQVRRPANKKLTWHFKADYVHDFVWAADQDYQHDIVPVNEGPELHFFYQKDGYENTWKQMQPFAVRCFQIMNKNFGKYPFPKYSIIQGGDGGMEYPWATLVTGHRSLNSLIGVVVHESIHSWYQGVLANNESLYYWMDEGFTSFAEDLVMNSFRDEPRINPVAGGYIGYRRLVESGTEEPSSTHADHFRLNRAYGTSAYSKGSVFLQQLSYVMGQAAFMKGMRRYFNTWKFKHPTPTDFKHVMEVSSGMELDWYLEYWIYTTKTIDYAIDFDKRQGANGPAKLTIKREGDMPMPIDVLVSYADGSQEYYYIPLVMMRKNKEEFPFSNAKRRVLPDWPWVEDSYSFSLSKSVDEVVKIEIDPTYRLADIEMDDNVYPKPKKAARKLLARYGAFPLKDKP